MFLNAVLKWRLCHITIECSVYFLSFLHYWKLTAEVLVACSGLDCSDGSLFRVLGRTTVMVNIFLAWWQWRDNCSNKIVLWHWLLILFVGFVWWGLNLLWCGEGKLEISNWVFWWFEDGMLVCFHQLNRAVTMCD